MVVVANSTPLIALSKIGLFELLKEYFGEVIITREVYAEVVTRGSDCLEPERFPIRNG